MNYSVALNKAMSLCAQSEHCVAEVNEKLVKWEVNEADAKNIIKTLIDDKFIDHERFAGVYARDKVKFNQWGKVKINMMLKMKRIESSVIKNALNSIDPDVYQEVLNGVIEKKQRTTKGKTPYEIKSKIAQHAIGKGFEADIVFDALKNLLP